MADTEDSGIVVIGLRISNLRFADDLAIAADGQSALVTEKSLSASWNQFKIWFDDQYQLDINQYVSRQKQNCVISVDGKNLTQLNNSPNWGGGGWFHMMHSDPNIKS